MISAWFLLGCVYFFLPAGVANMAPVFANKLLGKGKPIDGGRSWRKIRLLGDHKTWQGLIAGTITGGGVFVIQVLLAPQAWSQHIAVIDYTASPIGLGFMMGFGALFGDSVKSFFKRRVGVKPGTSWMPFDQIDFVLGAILFTALFVRASLKVWVAIICTFFVLHLLVNIVGWLLGLKDEAI